MLRCTSTHTQGIDAFDSATEHWLNIWIRGAGKILEAATFEGSEARPVLATSMYTLV